MKLKVGEGAKIFDAARKMCSLECELGSEEGVLLKSGGVHCDWNRNFFFVLPIAKKNIICII